MATQPSERVTLQLVRHNPVARGRRVHGAVRNRGAGETARSARVPIAELGLRNGSRLAYLFDFGDEWRLVLKVVETWPADADASYPMLGDAEGVPPLQYLPDDEEAGSA